MRNALRHVPLAAAVGVCLALAQPARAQHDNFDHGHDFHGGHFNGGDFHGRDFHSFSPLEMNAWRGGHWQQGWHDGRYAWWWIVGGGWYFYPAPIYPFPTYVPPAIVVQQPPPVPTGLPPAQSWYYCDNPAGYYPYVAACNGGWRQVPATPGR
jgi:hypothetical protein